jgi:hypothetical protein
MIFYKTKISFYKKKGIIALLVPLLKNQGYIGHSTQHVGPPILVLQGHAHLTTFILSIKYVAIKYCELCWVYNI